VLWTVGCQLRCAGCISPSLLDGSAGAWVDIESLAQRLLSLEGPLDGITLTGGEPFLQARSLARLCRRVTRARGWDVMVYSGYSLADLRARADASMLLVQVDLLVDGPYMEERPTDLCWRGSDNQVLHLLSARARRHHAHLPRARDEATRLIQMDVQSDGTFYLAGTPRRDDYLSLRRKAKARGLEWSHE